MMDAMVGCPKCGHKFELTAAVAGPLVAEARREADAAATARIEAARKVIIEEERKKAGEAAASLLTEATAARERANREVRDATDRLEAQAVKLAEAQAAQAEALRKSRELDEARRELELTVERRTTEGLGAARAAAELAAEGRLGAKLAERDQTIASMSKTVEDLRRKAEQGSQQTQGEAQELALEAALASRFPSDRIEPVGKGVTGGDCLQMVLTSGGGEGGKILWESKQTKNWADAWLAKLRDDGRAARADLLVIVTVALPKGVEAFGQVEGVWVCLPRHAVALAGALRQALLEAAAARVAGEGVETKAGLVYAYLTGPRFKARVGAIVEAFTTMREDLDAERRAIAKAWAKREAQIERVLGGTVGMYGDLQAIAGRSLAEIEGLDLARLAAPEQK